MQSAMFYIEGLDFPLLTNKNIGTLSILFYSVRVSFWRVHPPKVVTGTRTIPFGIGVAFYSAGLMPMY